MRVVEAARDAVDRFVEGQSRGLREELELAERASREARERRARERLRGGVLPERVLAHDYRHHYGSFLPGVVSVCRVRVFVDPTGAGAPVVIMSDLEGGTSVTNFVEEIAAAVSEAHALPPQTIWVDHVPPERYPHYSWPGEMYQVVTFPAAEGADFALLTAAEVNWIKALEAGEE